MAMKQNETFRETSLLQQHDFIPADLPPTPLSQNFPHFRNFRSKWDMAFVSEFATLHPVHTYANTLKIQPEIRWDIWEILGTKMSNEVPRMSQALGMRRANANARTPVLAKAIACR
jgi:hypothetical protein